MSASPSPLSDLHETQPTQPVTKRKVSATGFDGTGTTRSVKRRASKACQCCRARKVRCNVTEHGAPCTNCRLDEVDCIVSESRRKKKWSKEDETRGEANTSASAHPCNRKLASRDALDSLQSRAAAPQQSHDLEPQHLDDHIPHSIYQTHSRLSLSFNNGNRRLSLTGLNGFPVTHSPLSAHSQQNFFPQLVPEQLSVPNVPYFIKPLPPRIGPDEVAYLEKKGALAVPAPVLRNELLRSYVEFVHPYMPLLELYDFLMIVESGNGTLGRISLILFQAVMFAGSAFIDMQHLRNAGYLTRKEARKDFFQKTRLLYDFDYESDRVSLVQALLLLTYYYETPDDQKDTWHWMGVATSIAHTIGLHRNPDRSCIDSRRAKLWKRIWWSTYMRDRLIALGMRRPTRIKSEDYDVPMLTLDDFEIIAIPESVTCISADCTVARDVELQRQMAVMCIEKAKLCLCISHVLSKQYCVLNNNQGMTNDRTTMMLLPKKLDPETCEVKACDDELQRWSDELPPEAVMTDVPCGNPALELHRGLLHMVFFTTLSALHRPQVLPSTPSLPPSFSGRSELLEISRRNVRRAATAITSLAQSLDAQGLVRFLPTTGVTVLLPAIIIHLLDIKAPEEELRKSSLRGFCQCMQVMGKLRDIYAAADYSTAFLEAAIRKAGIQIASFSTVSSPASATGFAVSKSQAATTVDDLVDAGRRLELENALNNPNAPRNLTPPPDMHSLTGVADSKVSDEEVARRLETFLASTPPDSDQHSDSAFADGHSQSSHSSIHSNAAANSYANQFVDKMLSNATSGASGMPGLLGSGDDIFPLFNNAAVPEFDQDDFDSLLNLDAVGEGFGFGGIDTDPEWMKLGV
ncbi:hypothetical protein K402DRAFT_335789 [Aulographum hederae CBS 113979]|uniref:Zn(2)-C6 fungal-type domain-containing protein n=1 Tax=Aulographum hederae CBS 113979 TaxID=1176131 RepID=A0A6G1GUP7_9PEZI|nr:hypothetical protein K402DRAFT_335789 [Aulographum hederae CBS 113979]